MVEASCERANC